MKNWKNLSRRTLSLFLVLVMCLGMVNLTAFAAEAEGKTLICNMTEHTHTDECYERGDPICGKEVGAEGHAHTSDCYGHSDAPICGLEASEDEGHVHSGDCYTTEDVLICTKAESEGHAHGEDCYTTTEGSTELTCGQEGSEEHIHEDGCYTTTEDSTELTCGQKESEGHAHGEDCYESQAILSCGEEQTGGHKHTDACYNKLSCGQVESKGHQHNDACYKPTLTCDKEEHKHTDECYEKEEPETPVDPKPEEISVELEIKLSGVIYLAEGDGKNSYKLLESSSISTKVTGCDASDVELTVKVVKLDGDTEAPVELEEGSVLTLTNADTGTYRLSYTATVDDKELATATKTITVVDPNHTVGDLTDDDAYVTSLSLTEHSDGLGGKYVLTGTGPFDQDKESGNGYDKGQNDTFVRTYDTVSYQVAPTFAMQADASTTAFQSARVYYELVLPLARTKGEFDLDGMAWIKNNPEAAYELATVDGKQVLRGSFKLQSSSSSGISGAMQTMTVVVRVLAMHNGDTFAPQFTCWLAGNDVGASYREVTANDGAAVKIPTGTLVTGSGHSCATHNKAEYVTTQMPTITVSARSMYNLRVQRVRDNYATQVDTFDFSTGNDETASPTAPNRDAGTRYGILQGFAVSLELAADSSRGFRGLELPDGGCGGDITFTLDLSSTVTINKKTEPVKDEYAPLFWSFSQAGYEQDDGRPITAMCDDPVYTTPANTGGGNGPTWNGSSWGMTDRCSNGGTWTFEQISDSRVKVTVSGYGIDMNKLPSGWLREGWQYYNPNELGYSNPNYETSGSAYKGPYWNITTKGVFSTGEVWIIQPLHSATNGTFDEAGYIQNVGGYNTTLQLDYTLESTDKEQLNIGGTTYTQMRSDDQKGTGSYSTQPAGTFETESYYLQYQNGSVGAPLAPGCNVNSSDWARPGMGATAHARIFYTQNYNEYQGAAFDVLIKFDNAFLDPEAMRPATNFVDDKESSTTLLWGCKVDRKNWTDDEEMKKATADDLIFFTDLNTAKAYGAVVAGLAEYRGLGKGASSEFFLSVDGIIKSEGTAGNVYMITQNGYVWSKGTVNAKLNRPANSPLTLEQIKSVVPSRANTGAATPPLKYADSYADPWCWDNYTHDGKSYKEVNNLSNYKKAQYGEDGQVVKGTGAPAGYGGDSCLVLPYTTKVNIKVAQRSEGVPKETYSVDVGQRVADFIVTPEIVLTNSVDDENREDVTVSVTLPKGLTYIEGSSYQTASANYTQNSSCKSQGTFAVPGDAIDVKVEPLADGQTKLTWTLAGVDVNKRAVLTPIYFSCNIGTPDNSASDVKKGDSLSLTAEIWSNSDKRERTELNQNQSKTSIKIAREEGINVVKKTEQSAIDITGSSNPIRYTMYVENAASNDLTNAVILESLPFNGKNGSSFNGSFAVSTFNATLNGATKVNGLKFFYTTDEKYAGVTSVEAGKITNGLVWHKFNLGDSLESAGQITAIAVTGTLPKQTTLKMNITLALDGNQKPGDKLVNFIYSNGLTAGNTMEDSAETKVVCRTLEGLTWVDRNHNGQQDAGETRLPGVTVELYHLVNGEYQPYEVNGKAVTITSGQWLDLVTGKTNSYSAYNGPYDGTLPSSDADGRYLFTGLPEGTFAVRFSESDKVDLGIYAASPKDSGNDATDSDGAPTYEDGKLTETWIEGIHMPAASSIGETGVFSSKHNDSGFYLGQLTITKTVVDDATHPAGAASKTFSFTLQDPASLAETYATSTGEKVVFNEEGIATVKITGNGSLTIYGLPMGTTFTVTETEEDANVANYTRTTTCVVNGGEAKQGDTANAGVSKDSTDSTVAFTNAYVRYTGGLTITKDVKGLTGIESNKPHTYTFTVKALGDTLKKDVANKTFSGVKFNAEGEATVQITVTGNAAEVKEISGLPTGDYTVMEDAESAWIEYFYLTISSPADEGETAVVTVKGGDPVPAAYTNTYTPDPEQKMASFTIQKAMVDGNGKALPNSSNEYQFNVAGTSLYGTPVNKTVTVYGGAKTTIPLEKGVYTVTEVTPDAAVETGYTWAGVTFGETKADKATADLTGTSPVSVTVTATNHYTRDLGSLKIEKKVEGSADPAVVAQKVYTFTVTGPKDADGTYDNVVFKNGEATVTITGEGSVTIEGLPTGEYTVHEVNDNGEAEISGRILSSVRYEDNDAGEDAITTDGIVSVEKGETGSVTVTNSYRTPSSPSRPRDPDPDPDPDPEGPEVEIPNDEPPLAELPDLPPENSIPDEEPPLSDIPDDDVPLADVPKTGDNSCTSLWAMLSGISLLGIFLLGKKRQYCTAKSLPALEYAIKVLKEKAEREKE